MKTRVNPGIPLFCLALAWNFADTRAEQPSAAIPFSAIGVKATADYQGDALAIAATPDGARLHCGFQKLVGHATPHGLWLESTTPGGGGIRLVAQAVNRDYGADEATRYLWLGWDWRSPAMRLADSGTVEVADNLVRFIRPGLIEEYSVSVDGVRQDFVITERPPGAGDLRAELALSGAQAEATAYGVKLTLEGSGRTLAYSRLRATDATGRELSARLEVHSPDCLAVRVADANATYPVRIDPTFSDADWVSLNPGIPGANGRVRTIAVDASGNVYAGGEFTVIGTAVANHVAKWDGNTWSALGAGTDGDVKALALSDNTLYVGGSFTNAGGVMANFVARWNGSAWSALGTGMNAEVRALALMGTTLYAGGTFTSAGGVSATRVAKCDGSDWSALGSGVGNYFTHSVNALVVSGTNLYAGGNFDSAGGADADGVARWDGGAWSGLPGYPLGGLINALAVSGNRVYAAGYFITSYLGGNHIAMWDGTNWSGLDSGMSSDVHALAVSGNNLYAGGTFTTAGGVTVNGIARWNGSSWSALSAGVRQVTGTSGAVYALAVSGTDLYAGGNFRTAGAIPASSVAKWNGSTWSALGSGMNAGVFALAVSGNDLYVGGIFSTAGDVSANRIAKWDGSAWSALGSGLGSGTEVVYALAANGNVLYAGGSFTTAGGISAMRIAKWDGNTWSTLGSGMTGYVYALAVSGSNLYAGGTFTTAGGVSASRIARWNGSTWAALGSGMGGTYPDVNALVVSGTNLYAGGNFTTAGGATVNRIARWNGSAWSALGSGMDRTVRALAVNGNSLYAGGYFTNAGGVLVNRIAKWNGNDWSALGSGMDDSVAALTVRGSDLYAAGYFATAGGSPAKYIAKWNGSAWSELGSGMDSTIIALATDGAGHLFVGGGFRFAGGTLSPYVAQANLIPPGGIVQNIQVVGGSVTLNLLGRAGGTYAVQRATDVQFTGGLTTLMTTNAPANGQFQCTDLNPPSSTAFYRLLKL